MPCLNECMTQGQKKQSSLRLRSVFFSSGVDIAIDERKSSAVFPSAAPDARNTNEQVQNMSLLQNPDFIRGCLLATDVMQYGSPCVS